MAAGSSDRQVRFTAHARRRMRRRRIAEAEVLQVVAAPTRMEPSAHTADRWILGRRVRGRALVVIVDHEPAAVVVVSAWNPEDSTQGVR